MRKSLFYMFIIFTLISCSGPQVNKQADKPAVIREAVVSSSSDIAAWMTPDMKGKNPYRMLKPGEKLKVIKDTGNSVLVEMQDGARAWVKAWDIK